MSETEIDYFFTGCGYKVYHVAGSDPYKMHDAMAKTLDMVIRDIKKIKSGEVKKVMYPMIVLTTPKGWTGPKNIEKRQIEGSFRSHQVPIAVDNLHIDNISLLEAWLKSYHPERLFDERGRLIKRLRD